MGLKVIVDGLAVHFGAHPVLEGTEFTVRGGEMLALLGANGAGKTTLLRCIGKILEPTAGSILLDGRESERISTREAARLMAVVPQEQALDFDFTVAEIVRMGRYPYLERFQSEGAAEEEAACRAMELTGVGHLARRSITVLSGGEKQRVLMARAVCQDPQALLLDEPTANLDLGSRSALLELAVKLNREKGVTVITAIHDLNLAAHYFQRFLLLAGGRVLAAGRAEEVITAPNIHCSYGVPAFIYRHPLSGAIQVSVAGSPPAADHRAARVHVIAGGEEALPALEFLFRAGLRLSVGPVSAQDGGYRFARFHRLPLVEVPPFSIISGALHREHLQLIFEADRVVVPPVPFGGGNLRCLAAVKQARARGIPVLIMEAEEIGRRDFSGGRAAMMVEELLQDGAEAVTGLEALLKGPEKRLDLSSCGS